ncbi:hypothetical protein GQ457_07G040690 [Hibiscus cannabinus]
MHDADDGIIKSVGSSSNMSMVMYVDGGHVILNSNFGIHEGGYYRAPSALEDGDGDDDDDDGGYDYAPAA